MSSTLRTTAVLAALVATVATAGQAQSANIQATATVFTPMTVTGVRNLQFGSVIQNVPRTVAVADAGSGQFNLTGQALANVALTFTLPTNLTGAGNLAIGTWTGNHNTTASPTGTAFTPSASATNAAFPAAGTLFVYLGATVSPTAAQAPGNYTGTVTLTAAYF